MVRYKKGERANMSLKKSDPKIYYLIEKEKTRLKEGIELIASENYASSEILEATRSILTNKYAEGLPYKRYYGGCEFYDLIEEEATKRVKRLFRALHANVQPHSGSNANLAAFFAFLTPGDTVMGQSLAHGGHLTHGSLVNFSGKLFNIIPYGVHPKTETLDYDEIESLALKHKPKMIIAGASAYPRIIDFKKFSYIAKKVGAFLLVDMAHIAGLVATGFHPSPVPYADVITSTTHKTLRGPRSGFILSQEEYAQKVDKAVFPGTQGGPLMHVIAAKAVCFKEALDPKFKKYIAQVIKNAAVFAQTLKDNGFRIVSGGTDNHLLLVDVTPLKITGKEAEKVLDEIGITVNKNAIPLDKYPPNVASGIRIGTPAITTRGFKEKEIKEIAEIISESLKHPSNKTIQDKGKKKVRKITDQFPVPGIDNGS